MLVVVNPFKELEHDGYNYALGDIYPAEGFKVNAERVAFLSKPHPKYKTVFLYEEVTPSFENVSSDKDVQVEAEVVPTPAPKKLSSKEKSKKDGE